MEGDKKYNGFGYQAEIITNKAIKMKYISKKEKLLNWIKSLGVVKTSEVIKWGIRNSYNRAERTARDLATAGEIDRLSKSRTKRLYGDIKEKVWMII